MTASAFTDKEQKGEIKAKQGIELYEKQRTKLVGAVLQSLGEDKAQLELKSLLSQDENVKKLGLAEIYSLAIKAGVPAQKIQEGYPYSRTEAINNDHNYLERVRFLAEMQRKQRFEDEKSQLVKEIQAEIKRIDDEITKLREARSEFLALTNKAIGFAPTALDKQNYENLKTQRLAEIDRGIEVLNEQKNNLSKLAAPLKVEDMNIVVQDKNASMQAFINDDRLIVHQLYRAIKVEKPSFWHRVFGHQTKSDKANSLLMTPKPGLLKNLLDELEKPAPNLNRIEEIKAILNDTRPKDLSKKALASLNNIQKTVTAFQENELKASETLPVASLSTKMAKINQDASKDPTPERLAELKSKANTIANNAVKVRELLSGTNQQLNEKVNNSNEREKRQKNEIQYTKKDAIRSAFIKKQNIKLTEKRLAVKAIDFFNDVICARGADSNAAAKFVYYRLKEAWTKDGNQAGDPVIGLQIQRRAAAAASFLAYAIEKDRSGGLNQEDRQNIKTALYIYGELISTNRSLNEIIKDVADNHPSFASGLITGKQKIMGDTRSTFQKILNEFTPEGVIPHVEFVGTALSQANQADTVSSNEYRRLLEFHDTPEGNLYKFSEAKGPNPLEAPSQLLAAPFKDKIFPSEQGSIAFKGAEELSKIHDENVRLQTASQRLVTKLETALQDIGSTTSRMPGGKKLLAVQEVNGARKDLLGHLNELTQDNEKYSSQIAVRASLATLLYASSRELNAKLRAATKPEDISKIKSQMTYLFNLYVDLVKTGEPLNAILEKHAHLLADCKPPHLEPFDSVMTLLQKDLKQPDLQALLGAIPTGGLINAVNADELYFFHHGDSEEQRFYHEATDKNVQHVDNLRMGFVEDIKNIRLATDLGGKPSKEVSEADQERLALMKEAKRQDYEKRLSKDRDVIASHKELQTFYSTFIRKVSAEMIAAKSIYSGKVTDTRLTQAQEAVEKVQYVGSALSVFGGDAIASALKAGVDLHEERKKAIANTYLARSFATITEAEKFIEEVAIRLAIRQQAHLQEVDTFSSDNLAKRANRLANRITGNESLVSTEQYAVDQVESFLAALTDGRFGEKGLELLDPDRREEAIEEAVNFVLNGSVYVDIERAIKPNDAELGNTLTDLEKRTVATAAMMTESESSAFDAVLRKPLEASKLAAEGLNAEPTGSTAMIYARTGTPLTAPSHGNGMLNENEGPHPEQGKDFNTRAPAPKTQPEQEEPSDAEAKANERPRFGAGR